VLRLERFRQRGARSHLVIDVVEGRLEGWILDAAAQNAQRLHQRQPGFQQGGELLIEDQEFGARNVMPPRDPQAELSDLDRPAAVDREQEQSFFLEFVPEARFAFGHIRGLHHLPACGRDPAAKLHGGGLDPGSAQKAAGVHLSR
jgi:hypothetical protein